MAEKQEEVLLSIMSWLRQKTAAFRFDRQLYCVVTDTEFVCYSDEQMTKIDKQIPLTQISKVSPLPASSRPGFSFQLPNGSTLIFYDTSIHQAQKWICALRTEPPSEKVSIDSFNLKKVIGRGASGKVYLAEKKSTGERFAIKAIRKDSLPQKKRVSRVRAERNALMRAKHQFITRLFYAFQSPTKLYFVMEYEAGGDLRHHMDQNTSFSLPQIRIYLAELALALKTLHGLGIVYRDLKPENILLDAEGHIKLADFGLAKEINSESDATSICGTCEYIAPEMLRSQPQTFAVDWWSFGVIAFQLLCNRLPFASANPQRLFQLIMNNQPRIPNNLDSSAQSFLQQLLNKEPAKRLGSVGTDITHHPFFEDIDWDMVANKEYKLDFVPSLETPDSVENFDNQLTEQTPQDSYTDDNLNINVQGFSYVGANSPFDDCVIGDCKIVDSMNDDMSDEHNMEENNDDQ
ncbi:AGC family protein kinase [Trichomonas vaginalis G3]|uniref:AGC family protein kinase n=1 Tax=Trichomonas vaginalis (strain ATCC PRA-98 / G3) TaxID=412133 RepID=A2FIJ5_TRIV3|nr:protein serine/threonine kinase protein [Trichomonas vaginalis G3]EAX95276.1 AGC family protein kinase [Trichomonas vaginalis G3]KAI5504611.1 protein serine/threonine kinase protein [Trichomonas vaginalis G3]|eukprot:XP_001308206.1 AGC family protein kinase [Trichomonas vaginalis G3]